MQLYNTKVVPSAVDAQWTEPTLPDNFANARLLVLTSPFASGSAEDQTLQKMMAACKLSTEEYAVLDMEEGKTYSWNKVVTAGAPAIVLLLGITPAMLSI